MITYDRYQTSIYVGLCDVWTVSVSVVVENITTGLEFSLGDMQAGFSLGELHEFSEGEQQPEFSL